jgi:hypothetical protein
MMMTTQFFNQN